jgi:DNA ligase D-like protein (predicted polymerase)/DNA ligase D-like protein (predicted 3'-phosphoesterase)
MTLSKYKEKRNFEETSEPKGKSGKKNLFRFVIQRHDATRLHYDFRLELGGVLKSWAVPKGPSMNTDDKRLAVMVEDHPVDYIDFHGTIPEGNYGAGEVEVWDSGKFFPVNEELEKISETQALKALEKGELKIFLKGEKIEGGFVLVRMKKDEKNWLLIKHKDEFSTDKPYDIEKIDKKKVAVREKNETEKSLANNRTSPRNSNKKTEKQKVQVRKNKAMKHKPELTHTDKIYWPDEKYTKGDLLEYYEHIAPYILPYLKDRPLSLKRNPNGIQEEGFFHKDAGDIAPDWMKTKEIYSESTDKMINYLVCNDVESLLFIANLGCIEMNPWNSTIDEQDKPDYIVMDIDPSEQNTFDEVIDVALTIREILTEAGVEGYCKTSGSSGLHIYVPFGQKYTYEESKDFAHILATIVTERLPELTTIERSLSKRKKNQIYVDYLQNRRGQTLASAYSVRPKPGATVSAPLEWSEVKHGLKPGDFTIKNMMKRVKEKGDLFEGVLGKGIDIQKALSKLETIIHH